MNGRRWRRGSNSRTLLPLRPTRQHSSTVSCWYCDFKFIALNGPLFRFGRRYSRYLRVWFSVGIGFSIAALLGATVIILCELVQALLVYSGNALPGNSLSWFSSLMTGLSFSLSSVGYLCVSSVLCVFIHEFGHALAAASEGIQMEYLSVFLALLFPGALVAFNHASLESLPGVASLRIYCAGIWHNAAFCSVCTLALVLLPLILNPFYIYGESPMVLEVPSTSSISGYLSPRDVIVSLNDIHIHTAEDWKKIIATLADPTHSIISSQSGEIVNQERGYCVPNSLIEGSTHIHFQGNQTYCPNELFPFASMPCVNSSYYNDGANESNNQEKGENIHCLDAKDVVKLNKCSYNSLQPSTNRSGCPCSEAQSCSTPIQLPSLGWVEITYLSLECRRLYSDSKNSNSGEKGCLQTFVFVGDLISMAHSIHLTSYQPRWSIDFAAYLPSQLEKLFTCSFHVSMVLALLNSLPVFFLDGESILEVVINSSYLSLSWRKKRLILRCCLLGGTFISTTFILLAIFHFSPDLS
ncbi:hypothetical protein ACJIZ3_009843 [Penstemon smallii]|uniref:Endopeptidase S2P n=1 Tax=Penstemon smallii TaxID=265156 RepID=A0ABD3TE78_9LAMI